ncbi:MAG: alpha/beta fold hydrolase [Geminicoccaceae bacterium]
MAVELPASVVGEGRPMVILHGLLGAGRNWDSLAKRFAQKGVQAHVLDLRNHGSAPWAEPFDYPAMAEDVAAYIAKAGLDRPVLLGHSMGGKAAMMLALTQPERQSGVIIADIAPVAYSHDLRAYGEAMRAADLSAVQRRAQVDEQLQDAIAEAPIRAFLLQNLEPTEQGFRWRPNLDVIIAHMADLTGWPALDPALAFDGPALFIYGGASDYVGEARHEAILARFPNADFASIDGAGHWLHAERPNEFIAKVQDWLSVR